MASVQQPLSMEAPPSPLSSRPERSVVEGSAVLSTSTRFAPKYRPPLCHPACPGVPWDRSGGICVSLDQHPIPTEAPPSPLSSRPKWRDLPFSQPASDSRRSTALPFVIPPVPACRGSGAKRSGGICSSLNQAADSARSTTQSNIESGAYVKPREVQPTSGCPILRVVCEGWDTTNLDAHRCVSHP
jgi:hypothetical protein